jgi:hypothetical protein
MIFSAAAGRSRSELQIAHVRVLVDGIPIVDSATDFQNWNPGKPLPRGWTVSRDDEALAVLPFE